jgi:hypothetical protein
LRFKKEHDFHITGSFLCFFISLTLISLIFGFGLKWYIGLLFFALPLGISIYYIPKIRASNSERKMVSDGEYTVIKDTLVNVAKETIIEPHFNFSGYHSTHSLNEAEFLFFSSQKWRIPIKNYTWSDLYHMSSQGVSNTSIIG